MSRIGIFAKTFAGSDPTAVLAQVANAGFGSAHFNMACCGLAAMPDVIPAGTAQAVASAAAASGVSLVGLSGTWNMIHPDPAVRAAGMRRLEVLAQACAPLGTRLITLCTGTRDADDQWRAHPDNASPEAWRDILASMEQAVAIAERYDVDLGIEPELANVVDSAAKARQLLDEIGSPRLKIVLDPANLAEIETPERRRAIVAGAIDLLADHIAMAHAKDRDINGEFVAAGRGVIDFAHFMGTLQAAGFTGPMVAHGLSAAEAPGGGGLPQAYGRCGGLGMSTVSIFARPGVSLALHDGGGDGAPFVFQHGLCGSAAQTAEVMPDITGIRPLTLDCRGHGGSQAGDPAAFSIAAFTDDAAALIAERQFAPAIVGGISMGAAIGMRLAALQPHLVRALVIARPAWVTAAAPANTRMYVEVGELLARHPAAEARRLFLASDTARRLAADALDNLNSLIGFFDRAPLDVTAQLLTRIASDGPGVAPNDLARIACPVLIIGHGQDLAHPWAACQELAHLIPQSRLVEITPKARDKAAYVSDFKAALAAFLKEVLNGTA